MDLAAGAGTGADSGTSMVLGGGKTRHFLELCVFLEAFKGGSRESRGPETATRPGASSGATRLEGVVVWSSEIAGSSKESGVECDETGLLLVPMDPHERKAHEAFLQKLLAPLRGSVCTSANVFWTAYVEVSYTDQWNRTFSRMCECGIYGSNSPLLPASGQVVLPNLDPLACSSNTTFSVGQEPWIALIKRGDCTYTEKIQAAQQNGASAVVIYNLDGTGNETNYMSHPGTGDTVVIMIGNLQGREISDLIKSGVTVYMQIAVGSAHGPWNKLWVYVMSFTFFGVTAIALGYFVVLTIRRLYHARQERLQQRHLKTVAKKAIDKLQVRTLRRNDPEVESNVESNTNSCAVCIESFRHGDVVTVLPCSHLFHKTCIEPWLLEHRTCPMCKYDILKGEVSLRTNEEYSAPPADVRFYPITTSNSQVHTIDEVTLGNQPEHTRPNTDTQVSESAVKMPDHIADDLDPQRYDHIYENPAFEGEQ
ncbi:RING finger protein 148 [Chanos chanos]|uniref:RING finger protein 148 n=1 Tax=Chanos chanos TaxID=29144 RepID=A0A6J2UQW8_CHACN|nr:RING finger protein 148-like [Chanos chanos]